MTANDATFNVDPEFRDMDIDDEMDIDLEGADPVDDPSIFPGFECTPDYASALKTSPGDESYVQYRRRGLSTPHAPPPRRAFSTPNLTSSIEERSLLPQRTESTTIYSQLPNSGRPDPIRGHDKKFGNLLTTMRICLAAITRFK